MPSKIPKDTILYRLVEIFPEYKFKYNKVIILDLDYSIVKVKQPLHT
jgi:hypothetical protein